MLRIRKSDLDRALEYWRLRCESYEGEEIVPIYISSLDGKEKKECHITFSEDGKSLLIVEDDPDQTNLVLKDGYLHHEVKTVYDRTPLAGRGGGIMFSERRAFGEGDETLTVPHRDYFMNRFTKGE